MATTAIDTTIIEEAVTDLKNLVTDTTIADFEKLKDFGAGGPKPMEAGSIDFEAAQWLEDLLLDRRNGIIQHVKHLRVVFNGLAEALQGAATAIVDGDTNGANNLALTKINSWIAAVKSTAIPPALGPDHYLTNKDSYSTKDNGSLPNYRSFEYGPDGNPVIRDGAIVVKTDHTPVAVPGLQEQYHAIINEANQSNGSGTNIDEVFLFSDPEQHVKTTDPVDDKSPPPPSQGSGPQKYFAPDGTPL